MKYESEGKVSWSAEQSADSLGVDVAVSWRGAVALVLLLCVESGCLVGFSSNEPVVDTGPDVLDAAQDAQTDAAWDVARDAQTDAAWDAAQDAVVHCEYGSDCESGLCNSDGLCEVGCNVIVNGSAENGDMSGWAIVSNGGDGWNVEAEAPPPTERDAHNFATSYELDRKSQVVDLVAVGFSAMQLASHPAIYVCDWVRRRWDGNGASTDYFYVVTELRDESNETIDAWNVGSHQSLQEATWDTWVLFKHTYQGYSQTPRYVYFEDGGRDSEFWEGWYGVKFDGARITVMGLPCPSCFDGVQNQNETGVDCGGGCPACN